MPHVAGDEPRLVTRIVELATQYGRYGYRRITALLRGEGWRVNHKRVERLWRQEGLKVPQRQPKRRRLWLNDGSCVRLRPAHREHVWSYDFVLDRTHDGRAVRMLTIIDEYTRECLAIDVARRLTQRGRAGATDRPVHRARRSRATSARDNGAEFTANAVRDWLARVGVQTLFIEPGSPWENGYIESFNGKLRDELLDRRDASTRCWRQGAHRALAAGVQHLRPHSSLGYRPPAPEAIAPPRLWVKPVALPEMPALT